MTYTTTKSDLTMLIKSKGPLSVKQLIAHFKINRSIIHRHLKDLIEKGLIQKLGSAPKVVYAITNTVITNTDEKSKGLSYTNQQFLNQNYYTYDSDGQVLSGYDGFIQRCIQRGMDVHKQFDLYYHFTTAIEQQKDELGLINGYQYLDNKLGTLYLEALHFVHAYQIGHFGKSKLGSITFYAKQSQNKDLIKKVVQAIKYPISNYIKLHHIDAICFIPPSITRPIQFMYEIKKQLGINLPEITMGKFFPAGVVIPQKSLKSMEQRIKNATNTLFITSSQDTKYKKVLLIDDFMGSGATLNMTAKKIYDAGISKHIEAISILGNIDTKYEVINEV
ncbi:MAG TPA: ArsR family transcriptional regulator [Candidatus Absconditabacterales bacterium]|nr:ArsR family transcriptional regulator [Candidatus Absconditabacterales bacterium]HNG97175.1 ArsR family transcriptional regulator [Candidatus Absconditabacterales bacterium]